jgi:phosphoglucosamine mutase
VLVRYSGTENICRVMVEGPKRSVIQTYATKIANSIKKQIGSEER